MAELTAPERKARYEAAQAAIGLLPGWTWEGEAGDVDGLITPWFLRAPAARPDACDPTEPDGWAEMSISDTPAQDGNLSLAAALFALILVDTFHELTEFVTVDGQRIAESHPEGGENWEWMYDQLRRVVDRYVERWPGPAKDSPT